MSKLYVFKRTKYFHDLEKIYFTLLKILNLNNYDSYRVNLIFINRRKMKKINNKYRGVNMTTDVLSFLHDWQATSKFLNYRFLGDIYICKKQIKKQAQKNNDVYKNELLFIFLHGLLHLLGYDHNNFQNVKKMNLISEKILKSLNLKINRKIENHD